MAKQRKFVRDHLKTEGWQIPPGNLLQRYFEACERLQVMAITGVATQLHRRVRAMQALPYHLISNQGREQLFATLQGHVDPEGLGEVEASLAERTLETLNPRMRWREALAAGDAAVAADYARVEQERLELRSRDRAKFASMADSTKLPPLPVGAFVAAARAACEGLPDPEVAQGVLEVMAAAPSSIRAGSSGPQIVAVLFRFLDTAQAGQLEAADLVAVALHICGLGSKQQLEARIQQEIDASIAAAEAATAAAAAAAAVVAESDDTGKSAEAGAASTAAAESEDAGAPADASAAAGTSSEQTLSQLLALIRRKAKEPVSEPEFVSAVYEGLVPLAGLSGKLAKLEGLVLHMMNRRVRPRHHYDFSREYLGTNGFRALVEALKADDAFVALSLSGTGLTDANCELLLDWLKDHPSVTSLDVSSNPIGDRGGVLLTQLLEANPRITDVNVSGTHFMRGYSRTHTDNLGPSACENGRPLLQALRRNQTSQARSPRELLELLRSSSDDLKALFVAYADQRTGLMPLDRLVLEVTAIAQAWGFNPEVVDQVLTSDRLLGTGSTRNVDDSGTLHIRFQDFLHFLEGEEQLMRVAQAVKHHRVQTKRLFYKLADKAQPSTPPLPSAQPQWPSLQDEAQQQQQQQQEEEEEEKDDEVSWRTVDAAAPSDGAPAALASEAHSEADPGAEPSPEAAQTGPREAASGGGDVGPVASGDPAARAPTAEGSSAAAAQSTAAEAEAAGVARSGHEGDDGGAGELPVPDASPAAAAGAGAAAAPAADEGKAAEEAAAPTVLAPFGRYGPEALLSHLKQALVEAALQPGSGWAVSVSDLDTVLQPQLFAAARGAPPPADLSLSWPEFFGTILSVLNS